MDHSRLAIRRFTPPHTGGYIFGRTRHERGSASFFKLLQTFSLTLTVPANNLITLYSVFAPEIEVDLRPAQSIVAVSSLSTFPRPHGKPLMFVTFRRTDPIPG